MKLFEACDELAIFMQKNKTSLISDGWPIDLFIRYLGDGETPKMALVLVKIEAKELQRGKYES